MPVKLYTGKNSVLLHKDVFSSLGRSCLVLTGSTGAKMCGALDDVTSVLDELNIRWRVFDKIRENPSISLCIEAGNIAHLENADFIVGIGGGSVMDAAKATAIFASNPGMSESKLYSLDWECHPKPIVLVGTTAGTGSEVTNVSVLTDSQSRKHSIHDNRLYAVASFGDPSYTQSLNLKSTLSTGIDVLAHCTESYFSKKANSISETFSIRGISLLYSPLLKASRKDVLDFSDRSDLYDASIFGGLAISVTGTVFPHSVGYYFTENYSIPHGTASAIFLPELLEHAKSTDCTRYSGFLSRAGFSESELISLCVSCVGDLEIHMSEYEIASSLSRWENNGSVKNTVGDISTDYLKHILTKKFLH